MGEVARVPRPFALPVITLALGLGAAILSWQGLASLLPVGAWWRGLTAPAGDVQALVFANVALPRIVVSWIVGAALALAGTLLQQTLRTPLADTTTLGVASGAYLALTVTMLFVPTLLGRGQEAVALLGAGIAALLVFGVAGRMGFSPVILILAGLTVSLLCGAAGATLTVLNHDNLSSLFIWQTGSLVQNGWGVVLYLLPRIAAFALVAVLLVRPLLLLELGDDQAKSLGLPVAALRAGVIALGVVIGAVSVSAVGVIGFVGVAAPNLVRFLGARTLRGRLFWAPVIGALLLWLTDQGVQRLTLFSSQIPTGSAAALLGAPLLLWILVRQGQGQRDLPTPAAMARRAVSPNRILLAALSAFIACLIVALMLGKGPDGWQWLPVTLAPDILPWRWPRVMASASAGAMLAVGGLLLQRMTGNVMASPEVLGVSSGAALGVVLLLFVVPGFSSPLMTSAAFCGALATLAAILLVNRRSDFAPDRLLLTGMAFATIFSAFAAVLLTSGDPRGAVLLAWMSGSTYRVSEQGAVIACAVALLLLALVPWMARWLDILPLGAGIARSLGVGVARSRVAILVIAALLTAMATMTVGPLSFVGLLAPQAVRALGVQRPRQQIAMAAASGATLMVAADWLGRTLIFPWQIPAGLVAALLGGPPFFWLIARRR